MQRKRSRKTWVGRIHLGGGKYQWVGRFDTRKERDFAVAKARAELGSLPASGRPLTCRAWADRWLSEYAETHKDSSTDAARSALRRFLREFGDRRLGSITRDEAKDWARGTPAGAVAVANTLMNAAVREDKLSRSPFVGLTRKGKGRSNDDPPTPEEFGRLLDACDALGWYGPQERALLEFAAYTGMRPGELFALEWDDVDMEAHRVRVRRRVYKGRMDLPKSNEERTIALPPPARDVLLALRRAEGYEDGPLVFRSKRGRMMSQASHSGYWAQVKARAGLEFDFYLASKHYGVSLLYRLGLSQRAIGAQMGWSEKAVEKLLRVYGHIDLAALGEVDALYEAQVVELRPVKSDAG